MFRQIVSLLAISPLALNLIATTPAQAQIQPSNCNQQVFEGANFGTIHIFPQDPNVYTAPLRINQVNGSRWSGILNIHNNAEKVYGTIDRSEFTMKRPSGQTWFATCTPRGISGNLKKPESLKIGSFLLTPNAAQR